MSRDELVKAVGEHVISCFEKWTKNPIGKAVVVPIKIPRQRYAKEFSIIFPQYSDWVMTCECSAPTMCETAPGGHIKVLSLSEALERLSELKKDL